MLRTRIDLLSLWHNFLALTSAFGIRVGKREFARGIPNIGVKNQMKQSGDELAEFVVAHKVLINVSSIAYAKGRADGDWDVYFAGVSTPDHVLRIGPVEMLRVIHQMYGEDGTAPEEAVH